MRLSLLFALALTTALVWATPAFAGRVCANGGVATFGANDTAACGGTPSAGETNALSVSTNSAGAIVFTDSHPITDADGAGGCTTSGNVATCPGTFAFQFDLGDGNDTASGTNIRQVKARIRESEVLVYAIGIDGEGETTRPQPPMGPWRMPAD